MTSSNFAGKSALVCAFVLASAAGAWGGCAANSAPTSGPGGGGSGAAGGGQPTGGETCPGATLCGESCTNTALDPNNCGACGIVCPMGQVCSSATCSVGC